MWRVLRFVGSIPRKVNFVLRVMLFNPVTGIITIIGGIAILVLHAQWAALALIAAGAIMCWAFGMYYADGFVAKFGGKK